MKISLENLLTWHLIVPTCDLSQQQWHPIQVTAPSWCLWLSLSLPAAVLMPMTRSFPEYPGTMKIHADLPGGSGYALCSLVGLCSFHLAKHHLVFPREAGRCVASHTMFKKKDIPWGKGKKIPSQMNRIEWIWWRSLQFMTGTITIISERSLQAWGLCWHHPWRNQLE